MFDPDAKVYSTRQAAEAAGFSPSTLRTLFSRGQFEAAPDSVDLATEKGLPNRFSLRGVIQLAIAKRLWASGADPKAAFWAAASFTHVGKADSYWVGEKPGKFQRAPGQLFPNGYTLLIFEPETASARIINCGAEIDLGTIFSGSEGAAPMLVPVDEVVLDVYKSLGVNA